MRLYLCPDGTVEAERERIRRAAEREHRVLTDIRHGGIIAARGFSEHERGPALVFDYSPKNQRLDHYLLERERSLDVLDRIDLLRQTADALRYAHDKRLYHRALTPHAITVRDPDAKRPELALFDWQMAAREMNSARLTSVSTLRPTSHVAEHVASDALAFLAPEVFTGGREATRRLMSSPWGAGLPLLRRACACQHLCRADGPSQDQQRAQSRCGRRRHARRAASSGQGCDASQRIVALD